MQHPVGRTARILAGSDRLGRTGSPGRKLPACHRSASRLSVHAYWNLRPGVIWDTIQNDLPPLVEPLRRLLSAAP